MLISRYKNDTYPLVVEILINNEPVDFTAISSMDLVFTVDGEVKTITSTSFDTEASTVSFSVSSNPTIFDDVGTFPASIVGTETLGYVRTYDVGKLVIKPIVEA